MRARSRDFEPREAGSKVRVVPASVYPLSFYLKGFPSHFMKRTASPIDPGSPDWSDSKQRGGPPQPDWRSE